MTGPDFFSTGYRAARDRFRSMAAARGFRLESLAIAGGEDLTVDVAFGGDEEAPGRVIVSGGLHGVEGFLGSAIQLAILEADLPTTRGVGLVLVHAINPAGFAGLRRWDAGNVDLNRNFLAAGESYSGSPPEYRQLDPLLNPRHRPIRPDPLPIEAIWPLARHGMRTLRRAIAGGQYDYPLGLFFGGHAPSPTHRLLAVEVPRWAGDADRLIHVDVHSGLGPWGRLALLLDDDLTRGDVDRISGDFGGFRVEWTGERIAYPARGGLGPWCRAALAGRRYDYLCAEFGTYSGVKVLASLRAENQAHHWGEPGEASTARAKWRLVEAFAPASPGWREATVARGLELTRRACEVAARGSRGPRGTSGSTRSDESSRDGDNR